MFLIVDAPFGSKPEFTYDPHTNVFTHKRYNWLRAQIDNEAAFIDWLGFTPLGLVFGALDVFGEEHVRVTTDKEDFFDRMQTYDPKFMMADGNMVSVRFVPPSEPADIAELSRKLYDIERKVYRSSNPKRDFDLDEFEVDDDGITTRLGLLRQTLNV